MKQITSAVFALFCLSALLLLPVVCFSSPPEPPDEIELSSLSELFEPVYFPHSLHTYYAACSECHHHATGTPASNPTCLPCHGNNKTPVTAACAACHHGSPGKTEQANDMVEHRYHIDVPHLKGAYHINCIDCHVAVGAGPETCDECHDMTEKGEAFYKINIPKKTTEAGDAR